jgi:membrane-anchored protein YejM (alkaline phosphatase superfamily)
MLLFALLACGGTPTDDEVSAAFSSEIGIQAPRESNQSHLLLILIDTLRADSLEKASTPNIDLLSDSGTSAQHAWSAGTWTMPSMLSLFTGMSVRRHGWDEPSGRIGHYPILAQYPTLPEVLQEAGFETTAFYANPYLSEDLGTERGFDTYQRSADSRIPKQFEEHVRDSWGEGRHFAYLHLLGPHSPLRPSEAARRRWAVDKKWLNDKRGFGIGAAKRNREKGVREAYRAAYHAVIEDTDQRVGEIVQGLGQHRDNTWIVLTSDHGELLGEHNLVGHGSHVYQALTHVPFVVVPPRGQDPIDLPKNLANTVLPDLACRLLELHCEWPSKLSAPLPMVSQREGQVALSPDGTQKATWTPTPQQYNLANDPGEQSPMPLSPALAQAHANWLAQTPQGQPSTVQIEIDSEAAERLQALGYVE